MKDKKFIIKIIISIVLAFVSTHVLLNTVFVNNSTKISPYIGSNIISGISKTLSLGRKLISFKSETSVSRSSGLPQNIKNTLNDLPINKLGGGVYQKNNSQFSYLLLKEKEVDWSPFKFSTNGKDITILMPKGEQPPPKKL